MSKRKWKCHVKKNKNDKKTNNAQHIRSYNPYKMYRKTRLQPKTDDDLRISEKDMVFRFLIIKWISVFKGLWLFIQKLHQQNKHNFENFKRNDLITQGYYHISSILCFNFTHILLMSLSKSSKKELFYRIKLSILLEDKK